MSAGDNQPIDSSFQWVPEGGAPNPPNSPSHLPLRIKKPKESPVSTQTTAKWVK